MNMFDNHDDAQPPARQSRPGTPSLVVALDVPGATQALALADQLSGLPLWMKVGLELFTAEGPSPVRALLQRGFPVFLDLKYHDIPNTVHGAVHSASVIGAGMCTLHVAGGEAMCRAAVQGRAQAMLEAASAGGTPSAPPLLMGVTALTSQDGEAEDMETLVVERALAAKAWGLDGVVCSGREAAAVKEACGESFLCLCPGIRYSSTGIADRNDQARISTPREAVAAGADFLVLGRPIIRSADPAAAAVKALEHIQDALHTE